MKPRFLAFSRHLVLTSTVMMAAMTPLNTFAADYTWGGGTDSLWTLNANWTTGTAPAYGTDYTSDTLRINAGPNAAVYNPTPGPGDTTTFRAGRAFIVAGNLTVSSGTLAAARSTNSGSEPIMANGVNASILINGGAVDLSGHLNTFLFLNSGTANTSNLTISSGSFSSNGFNLLQSGTGVGTINLDGGFMAVTAFTRPATTGSTVLNLNGGTLRFRGAADAPNFLPSTLTGLQTIVKAGGAIIDSNGYAITIGEVLEHDATLGATPDGGLTKNGVGTLTLSGANTFTGPVTVNAGSALVTPSKILLANDSGAGTGAITLADSFTEIQVGNGRNIANAITISNTGDEKTIILPAPGFAAATFSGPVTINETNIDHFRVRADDNCFLTISGKVSGPGGIFKYQPGRLNLTNAANDFTGDVKITHGSVSFTNGGLGSTGSIRMEGTTGVSDVQLRWDPTANEDISSRLVMYNGKTATLVLAEQTTPSYAVANVTFANAIGNSSTAALVKTGPGLLTLTQPSTYSGGTTITQGTLGFPVGGLGTTGNVTMNGGTLRWETGNTEDLSSRIVMVDAKTAGFSTNGNNVTFASAIGGATSANLTKTGEGTLALTATNTYTGNTTINQGTLAISSIKDYGSNSAIGAPASGDIQLGSGSNFCGLTYTGSGDSTNRTVKLGDSTAANTGVGTIKNNGSGALTFTAGNFNPTITGITAARTLWLGGNYTGGPNEIQGIIQDNDTVAGGKVSVGKGPDASIWLLSGANTYTGSTIVQGGSLKIGALGSIASSTAVSISAGATLDTSAQSYTIPATQTVAFGIDAAGSGSSGKIAAAGLNVSNAVVTYNITGTPDDPVYVLATYTGTLGGTFASVDAPPAGYTLNYAYEGNKIALVQATGSPYQTWAGSALFNDDANGDGVKNGLAWILGAADKDISALTKLPTVGTPTGYLTLSFNRVNPYAPAKLYIEYSNNLSGWTKLEIPAGAGTIPSSDVEVEVTPGTPDAVTVKIPTAHASGGKLFGRLSATEN